MVYVGIYFLLNIVILIWGLMKEDELGTPLFIVLIVLLFGTPILIFMRTKDFLTKHKILRYWNYADDGSIFKTRQRYTMFLKNKIVKIETRLLKYIKIRTVNLERKEQ